MKHLSSKISQMYYFQEQSPEMFYKKRFSKKFRNILSKRPVPESFTEHLWKTASLFFTFQLLYIHLTITEYLSDS